MVYVRVAFRPGFPEISATNRTFSAIASSAAMAVNEPATQVHAAVAPQGGDIVVVKKRVSAFVGSDLEVVLRSLEVHSLVLAGISTSGVVLSTLRQAADLDYELTVLSDGVRRWRCRGAQSVARKGLSSPGQCGQHRRLGGTIPALARNVTVTKSRCDRGEVSAKNERKTGGTAMRQYPQSRQRP